MHLDINVWLFVRVLCVQTTKCWYKKPSDEDGRVQRVKPLYDDEIEPRFFSFFFFFLFLFSSFFFVTAVEVEVEEKRQCDMQIVFPLSLQRIDSVSTPSSQRIQ